MAYPATRLRRLRKSGVLRDLLRETELDVRRLVYPMFVVLGLEGREPIAAMPGIDRLSTSAAVEEAGEAAALGVPAVLLFGVPAEKDPEGTGAYDDEGVVQLATRAIKDAHPDLVVVTDVCLCEYTDHGHCGIVRDDGQVDNDASVELLARTAVSQARAGADVIAPSDMMDGRVGSIRAALDDEGMSDTPIVAYSVSGEYAMVRDAAAAGHLDERATVLETLTGIRRAGADIIVTYHAKDAARWLAEA